MHRSFVVLENEPVVIEAPDDGEPPPVPNPVMGADVFTSFRNMTKMCAPSSGALAQLHARVCEPVDGLASL